jgi:hypothetical protein
LGIVTGGPAHDVLLKFILMVIRSFSGFIPEAAARRGESRIVADANYQSL